MGGDPGKSLIRRAIECPAHDGLGSARSARAGSALRGGTPAEQPENRGPAARHRGMERARFLKRADDPRDLRMMGGNRILKVVLKIARRT